MPTHAQLAAKLLREAANFYRAVGEGNTEIGDRMRTSANVYDQVAEMVETDPTGIFVAEEEERPSQP